MKIGYVLYPPDFTALDLVGPSAGPRPTSTSWPGRSTPFAATKDWP
jgi:hypothetical protein